ncbi:hypothetical protein Sgly_0706 [Syntrophobotulus glycolicus DSM 8271]|uniref:Lipoprotein n=1 Tax=Syntrophobotulus glycolicus (strain DSM 8271 / FlGlyR) TaxID=645991 RepID=F0T0K3_SYNGF|nr:hypothetical protein [Syntrophobotulus glycolicus]ADY55068.1 hypothetical protein Sgly_0706 [Syntrophobotulus glycolicus DSM 8271]
MKTGRIGKLIFILLFPLICSGCSSSPQDIQAVIENYYTTNDKNNKGQLHILNVYEKDHRTYVLAEKYRGDGHLPIDLFIIDEGEAVFVSSGDSVMSPCFSLYEVTLDGKTIVYGDYKDTKWVASSDQVIDVNLKGIEISFQDNTVLRENFTQKNSFLFVIDTETEISDAKVYDEAGIVSTLSDLR